MQNFFHQQYLAIGKIKSNFIGDDIHGGCAIRNFKLKHQEISVIKDGVVSDYLPEKNTFTVHEFIIPR